MDAPHAVLPLTNPVQVFALVMVVILIAPLLLRRFRIPGLIGLILSGLLLGPHAFGILERGQTMQLLGMVGLLYIMFTAGLEFDLNEFARHRQRSFLFGTITFALPQAAATLAAVLVGFKVGLFGTSVINGAILMMLVTCLLGPWLADRYGRRLAAREATKPLDPGAVPQRILVPIANPTSMAHIMDVAMLIREAKLEQPLYPVSIAMDGPDVREEVVRSEKVLARALLHAAAADVPIHPVTRVELNVAQGLRRVIQETRSTVVVMGWDELPAAERFIFGSISDQLLTERGVLLLLCRLVHPPRLARRLLLAVPPLADREPGCTAALHLVRTLCRQVGAHLVVLAVPAPFTALLQTIARGKPALTVSTIPLNDWDILPEILAQHLQPDDMLLILSARRGTVSWHPGMDRLPQTLVRRFPETSLLVVYPAMVDAIALPA